MITPHRMSESYARNIQIIKLQTEGLNQQDSLVQLPFRANCMNWIVGHILTNRYNVLKLLGDHPHPKAEKVQRYQRESEPIQGLEPGVQPLDELIILLEEAQAEMADILSTITSEELERQVAFFGNRSMSVGEWLMFFYFHDSYHTGQTEILRQATGKDDKII